MTDESIVHFKTACRGRKKLRPGGPPAVKPAMERIPRISRLMALAIHFDGLIRKGIVRDYADLARLGGVTRARITQIMNLLNLPPWRQEEILFWDDKPDWPIPIERAIRAQNSILWNSLPIP